jgi:Arylsulfotransferase (ASST)
LARWQDRVAIGVSVAGFAALMWMVGALSARFGVPPGPAFNRAIMSLRETAVAPQRFYVKSHDFNGAKTTDAAAMAPGLTLVTSYFPDRNWGPGVRLIDAEGNVLHDWPIDLTKILPNRTDDQDYVHGSHLFPNGDILFNVEYAGVVRMDRCGKVLWQNDTFGSHHSVEPVPDGTFWLSGNTTWNDDAEGRSFYEAYPLMVPPIHEDFFVKISPEGEVLKSISSVEVLYRNKMQSVIVKMARGRVIDSGDRRGISGDVFHLNDVEELTSEMAPAFPMFEPGDILVSLRQLHMVMVVDPDDLRVKWHTITTSISQHDPDFMADGRIGIFDNNLDFSQRGTNSGGSRIVAVDPKTGQEEVLYPNGSAPSFFSEYSGKWQALPNGNRLITVSREGRALEVTATGDTVWEWISPLYGSDRVPEVMEATRYDIPEATIAGWTCPN